MSLSFHFTGTGEDLLAAHAALVQSRTKLRPWSRGCLVGLGFMWLLGGVTFAGQAVREGHVWESIGSNVLGSFVVWNFLLQPILARRRLRNSAQQARRVALDFTDSGVHVQAEGIESFDGVWADVKTFEPAAEGILFSFTDGLMHWLPNRVF
jgi:hypothetical protein